MWILYQSYVMLTHTRGERNNAIQSAACPDLMGAPSSDTALNNEFGEEMPGEVKLEGKVQPPKLAWVTASASFLGSSQFLNCDNDVRFYWPNIDRETTRPPQRLSLVDDRTRA